MGKKNNIKKKSKESSNEIWLSEDELIESIGLKPKKHEMATHLDAIYEDTFRDDVSDSCYEEYSNDEEELFKCQDKAMDRMYDKLRNGIHSVASNLLDKIDLDVEFIENSPIKGKNIKITPKKGKDWKDSAQEIHQLVNCQIGGGSFEEFKSTTSTKNDKELVKSHLGWAKTYSDCYGRGKTAKQLFNDEIEQINLRY